MSTCPLKTPEQTHSVLQPSSHRAKIICKRLIERIVRHLFLVWYENEIDQPKEDDRRKKEQAIPRADQLGESRINSIPGHIGLREKRKGPERISITGVAVGQIGIILFLKLVPGPEDDDGSRQEDGLLQ